MFPPKLVHLIGRELKYLGRELIEVSLIDFLWIFFFFKWVMLNVFLSFYSFLKVPIDVNLPWLPCKYTAKAWNYFQFGELEKNYVRYKKCNKLNELLHPLSGYNLNISWVVFISGLNTEIFCEILFWTEQKKLHTKIWNFE